MEKGNRQLHLWDKWIGIPMVIFLGLFRPRRQSIKINYNYLTRIALLNPASIGDTALLFGIVEDIKKSIPNSHITFFCGSSNSALANLCEYVDIIIQLKISKPLYAIKQIRKLAKFDIWIDCMPWPRINALLTSFADAKVKIGFKTSGQYRHYTYNYPVIHSSEIHELENMRNLIRVLGINKFHFPSLDAEKINLQKTVVIHMFPSGYKSYKKKWPDKKWAEIIAYLQSLEYKVYITGGKVDQQAAEDFVNKYQLINVSNVAGKLKLIDTIVLINSADLIITVNTGILHVAACLKKNLVSLNGPTSIKRWGAINENSINIQSPHKDAPCLNLGFEYSCNNENCNCMDMIAVDCVQSKINAFINF